MLNERRQSQRTILLVNYMIYSHEMSKTDQSINIENKVVVSQLHIDLIIYLLKNDIILSFLKIFLRSNIIFLQPLRTDYKLYSSFTLFCLCQIALSRNFRAMLIITVFMAHQQDIDKNKTKISYQFSEKSFFYCLTYISYKSKI